MGGTHECLCWRGHRFNFSQTVEGFSRLLRQQPQAKTLPPLYESTTSEALACALLGLSKVTNGSLRSITFQGGVDCAWLAAVSEWLLNLRVEIFDSAGVCLYSKALCSNNLHAQVIIVKDSSEMPYQAGAKAISQSYIIPPGQLCFSLLDEAARGDGSHQHLFSHGRTEWKSILHSTFGWAADELLKPEQAERMATFLCSGFGPPARNDSSILKITPWGILSSSSFPQIWRAFL
jgi:hypothetical protein